MTLTQARQPGRSVSAGDADAPRAGGDGNAPAILAAPILRYLARFERRRRVQAMVRTVGIALVLTLAWGVTCCLIDRLAALPAGARAAAWAVNAVAVALLLVRAGLRLSARRDWIAIAGAVERREPAFAQRLETVTSRLLHTNGDATTGTSAQLLAALAREVSAEVARRRGVGRLLPWSPALRPWMACAVLAVGALALTRVEVLDAPRLARRYATPWADIAPAATTRIAVAPGDVRIGAGETLHTRARGHDWTQQPMTVSPDDGGEHEARVRGVERDIEYFVTGGDARSDVFDATVLHRPAALRFGVRYVHPPHTRLPPRDVEQPHAIFEAPAGSAATVRVEASEPLASAELLLVGGGSIVTSPTANPAVRDATFTVRDDRRFTLRMTSSAGVEGVFRGGVIRALPDRSPVAVMVEQEDGTLAYRAADDYGLTRVEVELRVPARGSGAARTVQLAVEGDPRAQHGPLPLDLASLRLRQGEAVEVRLRVQDTSGQAAVSWPVRRAAP